MIKPTPWIRRLSIGLLTVLVAAAAFVLPAAPVARASQFFSHVQSTRDYFVTSASLAYVSNVTSGDLLVVSRAVHNSTACGSGVAGISDSLGNTWTVVADRSAGSGQAARTVSMWYAVSSSGGADTVSYDVSGCTNSGFAIKTEMSIFEFSGNSPTTAVDHVSTAFDSSVDPTISAAGSLAGSDDLQVSSMYAVNSPNGSNALAANGYGTGNNTYYFPGTYIGQSLHGQLATMYNLDNTTAQEYPANFTSNSATLQWVGINASFYP
jgi:hypothetical protein